MSPGAAPSPADFVAASALGLRWPCSADEVKAAHRRLALECHPDRNRGDEAAANARMARVNVARGVLSRAFAA